MHTIYVNDHVAQILSYLKDFHEKHADGCKYSCHEREVGYHQSTYNESYWFARFGGYCIGDLSRSVEVKADNLYELLPNVKKVVEESLARMEAIE